MPPDHITAPVVYKDIPGYAGYRVGDDGSIWSIRRPGGDQRIKAPKYGDTWRRLKPRPNHAGYLGVTLNNGEGKRRLAVHRLVLEAFVGPCPAGMEACHDPDPDPANCRLDNLRWDTKRANIEDSMRLGRRVNPVYRGEDHPKARLSAAAVVEIRRLAALDQPREEVARQFGITAKYVGSIIRRECWGSIASQNESADMRPDSPVADWVGMTYAERIDACRMMLVMHEFIPSSWSAEIKRRQVKRGLLPKDTPIFGGHVKERT